jgi:hypothetical protein
VVRALSIFQGHGAALGARGKERYQEHHFFHPVSNNHHQVGITVAARVFELSNEMVGVIECGRIIRQECPIRSHPHGLTIASQKNTAGPLPLASPCSFVLSSTRVSTLCSLPPSKTLTKR